MLKAPAFFTKYGYKVEGVEIYVMESTERPLPGALLSCFAKKVSKEREKGENSRAHSRGAKETSPFNPSARNDEKQYVE